MSNVTVTVNGQSVQQYVKQEESKEKSKEIRDFLKEEFRFFGRTRYMKFGGLR